MEDDDRWPENINEELSTAEIKHSLNDIYSHISQLLKFKYYLLIYNLFRHGNVSLAKLAQASGVSEQRLSKIIHKFKDQELIRQDEQQKT